METQKWIEVFSQGDVWELEEIDGKLYGRFTGNDPSDYEPDELVDNGVADVEQRAKEMGLEFEEEEKIEKESFEEMELKAIKDIKTFKESPVYKIFYETGYIIGLDSKVTTEKLTLYVKVTRDLKQDIHKSIIKEFEKMGYFNGSFNLLQRRFEFTYWNNEVD